MFFVLSKVAWFFLAPSNLMLVAVVLGLALAGWTRARRLGLGLAWAGALAMLVFGFSPASTWLLNALETRFPLYAVDAARPVDGIVLLGGAIQQDPTLALGQPVVNEAGDRLLATAALARIYPDVPIVLSGGSARILGADAHTEARGMAEVLEALGVAPQRLVLEERSKNTWQNAVYSLDMAEPEAGETWLLVTSAWHMPRSMGVFRQAGFDVVPYPVDYRTMGSGDLGRIFSTQSDGLRRLDVAVREIIGLVAYRLTGRTDALFPAP